MTTHSRVRVNNMVAGALVASTERLWKHWRWTLARAGQHPQPGEAGGLQADGGAGGLDGEEGVCRVQQLPSGVRERGLSSETGHLPGQRWGLLQQSQRQTVHHARPRQGRLFRWVSRATALNFFVSCWPLFHRLVSPLGNCAHFHKGGWWYNACGQTNLNGVWYSGGVYRSKFQDGIFWAEYGGGFYSLKSARLMIRPIDWVCPWIGRVLCQAWGRKRRWLCLWPDKNDSGSQWSTPRWLSCSDEDWCRCPPWLIPSFSLDSKGPTNLRGTIQNFSQMPHFTQSVHKRGKWWKVSDVSSAANGHWWKEWWGLLNRMGCLI